MNHFAVCLKLFIIQYCKLKKKKKTLSFHQGGKDLISGWGTQILHTMWCSQKIIKIIKVNTVRRT